MCRCCDCVVNWKLGDDNEDVEEVEDDDAPSAILLHRLEMSGQVFHILGRRFNHFLPSPYYHISDHPACTLHTQMTDRLKYGCNRLPWIRPLSSENPVSMPTPLQFVEEWRGVKYRTKKTFFCKSSSVASQSALAEVVRLARIEQTSPWPEIESPATFHFSDLLDKRRSGKTKKMRFLSSGIWQIYTYLTKLA